MKEKWIIYIGREEIKVQLFVCNVIFRTNSQGICIGGSKRTEWKFKTIAMFLPSLCSKKKKNSKHNKKVNNLEINLARYV